VRVDDRDRQRTSRNVKRWQNGDMCLRWTAAGMLEAERQFRRVIGYPKLPTVAVAVERDIAHHTVTETPAPEVTVTAV
jgi:putative transposase